MAKPEPKIPQSELAGRLQAFMLLRVAFVSLLLGTSIFIQIKENQTYFGYIQTFHYLLIVFVYFLTFVYVIILKWSKNLLWFAYLQLLVDTLFVTAIIFSTGGIESIFSFLYVLTIINASIILYRRGGFIISSCSSILYGLLLAFHYYNIIKPLGSKGTYGAEYQSFHLFYLILVNIAAFYLVAYLSSFLAEQVKKGRVELDAKQIDIDKLEVLNESIINSISSGLIALDDHNCIILFNPAAEEFFETRANHVFGRQIEQAFPFLTDYLSDIGFSSIEKNEKNPSVINIPYLKRNNKNIFLRFSIAPLRVLSGNQKGHILIFNDITKIREIEEAIKKVEALAMIGELAAGMAHEIRNPMASISGSIQMLKDGLEQDNINSRLMDIISR